ncbi:MAG: helix-turn-helix domain-containing protein [Acidimicrobiales bacterium]
MEFLGRHVNRSHQGERLRRLLELTPSRPPTPEPRTPARACRRLTDDEIAQLVAGYASGVRVDDLVAQFHVDQTTVQKYVRLHGLPRRQERLGTRQLDTATALYRSGTSIQHVATALGVSPTTVRRYLVTAGVTLRKRGRPKKS